MPEDSAPSAPSTAFRRSREGRALLPAAPWVAVLLLISWFQFFRGALLDGLVFVITGVLLAADAGVLITLTPPAGNDTSMAGSAGTSETLQSASHPNRRWLAPLGLLSLVVLGAVLVLAPRRSTLTIVVLTGLGILTLLLAWSGRLSAARRPRPSPESLRKAAALWALAVVITGLWEVLSFFLGRTTAGGALAHPALSDLINPALDDPLWRVLFVTAWLSAGAWLFRRGGAESGVAE